MSSRRSPSSVSEPLGEKLAAHLLHQGQHPQLPQGRACGLVEQPRFQPGFRADGVPDVDQPGDEGGIPFHERLIEPSQPGSRDPQRLDQVVVANHPPRLRDLLGHGRNQGQQREHLRMRVGESCGVLVELFGTRDGQHLVLEDQAFGTHARIEVEVDVTVLAADHTGRQLTVQRRRQAQGLEDRFRLFGVLLREPRQHVGVEELLPRRGQQEQGVTT